MSHDEGESEGAAHRPTSAMRRLPLPAALERGRPIHILLDGRPVQAFEGETVAAVLAAEEELTTRWTARGAPRGIFCGMGVCFDCLVVVDDVPSTRACMTWVREGMRVERQRGLA
ncbi:MAG TPA: (2Fe-2S)-binding protein [Gaiellaceae bacterium]|nr:(2Fe-2S)-binding protein [Gaiellaceae bacterium]